MLSHIFNPCFLCGSIKFFALALCMLMLFLINFYHVFSWVFFALSKQVRHMFDEIDYVLEAKNAERFASLYGSHQCKLLDTRLL